MSDRPVRPLRPLTPRQAEVLDYLAAHLLEHHRLPTVRELRDWLGATAVAGAEDYIRRLRANGYLDRVGRGARGTYRILHLSDGRPAEISWQPDPTTTHPEDTER